MNCRQYLANSDPMSQIYIVSVYMCVCAEQQPGVVPAAARAVAGGRRRGRGRRAGAAQPAGAAGARAGLRARAHRPAHRPARPGTVHDCGQTKRKIARLFIHYFL